MALEIMENDKVEFYWPDVVPAEKTTQKWAIVDIAPSSYFNVVRIEDRKTEKYKDLAFEVRRLRHVETTMFAGGHKSMMNCAKTTHRVNPGFRH